VLEVERHEGFQGFGVVGCEAGDCLLDGGLELSESGVVTPIDGAALDELPEPFDKVQVR